MQVDLLDLVYFLLLRLFNPLLLIVGSRYGMLLAGGRNYFVIKTGSKSAASLEGSLRTSANDVDRYFFHLIIRCLAFSLLGIGRQKFCLLGR